MRWKILVWLFAIALTLHNAEEAVWLPAFAMRHRYWRIPATVLEVRLVLVLLTLSAYVGAWSSCTGDRLGTYLLCGLALTMLLNVAVPHLIMTLRLRQYAPGTGTALCLNLPVTWLLLRQALLDRGIESRVFFWAGPLFVVALVAGIALLLLVVPHLLSSRRVKAG